MNQIERLIEVKLAQRTIEGLDRQLFHLRKTEKRLVETLLSKATDPDVRAGAQFDLATLTPRIAALDARRLDLNRLIDEMDDQAAQQASIRVISGTGDRAQIVLTYLRDDGKKLSTTRHVRREGQAYVGFSTLTRKKVTYHLPDFTAQEAT